MSQAVGRLDIRGLKVSLRKSEVAEEWEKTTTKRRAVYYAWGRKQDGNCIFKMMNSLQQ